MTPFRRLTAILLPALALAIPAGEFSFAAAARADSSATAEPDFKRGDLVVRRGNGFWSDWFRKVSTREKRFSHVGVVTSVTGAVLIVHAEADDLTGIGKVRAEPWPSFRADSREFAVYRHVGGAALRERIAAGVEQRLGVPFDSGFDLAETNRLYCSELVALAVNDAVGSNLVGVTEWNGREVIAIDDLYRRDFFKVFDSRE